MAHPEIFYYSISYVNLTSIPKILEFSNIWFYYVLWFSKGLSVSLLSVEDTIGAEEYTTQYVAII